MARRNIQLLSVMLVLCGFAPEAFATSEIGKSVADFTLKSHRGREYSLKEFEDKKVIEVDKPSKKEVVGVEESSGSEGEGGSVSSSRCTREVGARRCACLRGAILRDDTD